MTDRISIPSSPKQTKLMCNIPLADAKTAACLYVACKQQNRHRSRRESAAIYAAKERNFRVQYAVFGATSNHMYKYVLEISASVSIHLAAASERVEVYRLLLLPCCYKMLREHRIRNG